MSQLFALALTVALAADCNQPKPPQPSVGRDDSSVFGVFAGSSPCGEAIKRLFDIPSDASSPLRWKLILHQDSKTRVPAGYKLECDYNPPKVADSPTPEPKTVSLKWEGRWAITKGSKFNPDADVFELSGAVSLVKVNDDLLHMLNPDRSLMVGNGGWSYTMNRFEASEKVVIPSAATLARPSESYSLSPLAVGPSVFGVFEGRSPCQGIARELKIAAEVDCAKVKWRITLYQDPATLVPTRYKVESSLNRKRIREGSWSVARGTAADPSVVIYHLAPANSEADLFLLKGDDNVLFFLDRHRKPLVGHTDFSYTLNRRDSPRPSIPEPRR
jgi:hypothetical protein